MFKPHLVLSIRLFLFLLSQLLFGSYLASQQALPIKRAGLWGLMDGSGNILRQPSFDLLGSPDAHGYLLVQQANWVGLLSPDGQEILPAQYDDIQVLDAGLFSVFTAGNWRLLNQQGVCLLEAGEYQQIRKLSEGYYAFRKQEKWGLLNKEGRKLAQPAYDYIRYYQDGLFELSLGAAKGLLDAAGLLVVPPIAEEFSLSTDALVFYKQKGKWGANTLAGEAVFPAIYDHYRRLGSDFIVLRQQAQLLVYSLPCQRLFPLAAGEEVLSFSANYLAIRNKGQMGLLNNCGQRVLASSYQEIQPFSIAIFRVRQNGKWGLVAHADQLVLEAAYDYISPLQGQLASLLLGDLYGLLNYKGELLHPPSFSRIELASQTINAYTGPANGAQLQRYHLDAAAQLVDGAHSSTHYQIKIAGASRATAPPNYEEKSSRLLSKFEWFYEAENRRWGLRDHLSGQLVYAPTFSEIEVLPGTDLTLVALPKTNAIELERTSFKTKLVFGLLQNSEGKLITGLDMIDLRLEDWEKGLKAARCMFDNGKFGLIDQQGRILQRDLAFIGDFEEGRAAVSVKGKISGSLLGDSPHPLAPLADFLASLRTSIFLLDYTSYDQAFARQADLICENCEWGFMANDGELLVPPQFEVVQPFQNGHAIVRQAGQYGLIDAAGRWVVRPHYQAIDRLQQPNGLQSAYRLQQSTKGAGLLDTLGQLLLPPQFEEIGPLSEGLMAVNQGGRWGYANDKGTISIPFDYAGAKSFSESKAAVKTSTGWGHINQAGQPIYPQRFQELGHFSQGLAWAKQNDWVGYIDTAGNFLIPAVFQGAADFYQGVAIVQQGNAFGLINTAGEWILKPKYLAITPFQSNGIAVAQLAAERFVLINLAGKLLTSNRTYKEIAAYQEGLALFRSSQGYGFLDEEGREHIPPTWSWAASFSNGRAVVKQNGRCGYIDQAGQLVVPCRYARCLDFSDGQAAVFTNIHNAGLIDLAGKELIAPNLNRMIDHHQGMSLMRDDKQGYYFLSPQATPYDAYYEEARAFRHGVAAIRSGTKWGLISTKGLPLVSPKFSALGAFEAGVAKVHINQLYGLVGANGERLLPAEYQLIESVGAGLYRVEKDNEIGYFSAQGRWVWPLAK